MDRRDFLTRYLFLNYLHLQLITSVYLRFAHFSCITGDYIHVSFFAIILIFISIFILNAWSAGYKNPLSLITELKMPYEQPIDISEELDFKIEPTTEHLVNCIGKSKNKSKKRCGRCKRPVCCGKCISCTRVICKKS